MAEKYFQQSYWSGGLSESELLGPKGSFSKSFGVDIHETPGAIKAAYAPTKESAGTVTDLCTFAIDASDGNSYWFSDKGTIYKRTSGGAWGTVYKEVLITAIKGAAEFEGNLYWVAGGTIRKKIFPGAGDWTDVTLNWGTISSTTYHPILDVGLYLLIGGNTTIDSIDSSTGTLTKGGITSVTLAELPSTYAITSLIKYGIDILVGTSVSGAGLNTKLLRWDLASPTWTQDIDVPEDKINSILLTNNRVFLQAGSLGKIYEYNGTDVIPFRTLASGQTAKTYSPQSVANYKGVGYFGITDTNAATLPGLYALGRKNTSYPVSLCHQFVPSPEAVNDLRVGAMLSGYDTSDNEFLLFAWQHSTGTFGVDKLGTSRYNGAYVETQAIDGNPQKQKTFGNYVVSYKALPANTNISCEYYKNFASGTSGVISLTNKSDYNNMVSNAKIEAGAMKFKLILGTDGSDTPEISSFYCDFNEKSVL